MTRQTHLDRAKTPRMTATDKLSYAAVMAGDSTANHPAGGRDPEEPGSCWAKSRQASQKAEVLAGKRAHAIVGPKLTAPVEMLRDRVPDRLEGLSAPSGLRLC